MENVHHAIAWYQTKIGSYDKQLWEQSVEKKLQKQPPFVFNNAPRKKVRLKTEYIDVDLIRGSTFAKTKPQVPWVYITRKAIARVLFFPFYYNWWVHQTSKRLYALLLVLYVLQVITVIVYLRNFDHGIMQDELCFTEVILPTILMFLLCLIHSQTVLAHINHKPSKRNKNISGVTRKPRPKKASRKGRSSGNNSTCPEDGANTDTSRSSRRQTPNQNPSDVNLESHSFSVASSDTASKKSQEPPVLPSFEMEKNLLSRSVSDYDLKPTTRSTQNQSQKSVSLTHPLHHRNLKKGDGESVSDWHERDLRKVNDICDENDKKKNMYCVCSKNGPSLVQKPVCNYTVLDNLCDPFKMEKMNHDTNVQLGDRNKEMAEETIGKEEYIKNCSDIELNHIILTPEEKVYTSKTNKKHYHGNVASKNSITSLEKGTLQNCVDVHKASVQTDISKNVNTPEEDTWILTGIKTFKERDKATTSSGISSKSIITPTSQASEDVDLDLCKGRPSTEFSKDIKNIRDTNRLNEISQVLYPGTSEVFIECPSGADNLSEFEIVNCHVPQEKSTSGVPVIDLASYPCNQAWDNDLQFQSLPEATATNSEINFVLDNIVSKPRSLKSQDSSDSGINNEVPCMECSQASPHKDTDTCSIYDCTHGKKWQVASANGVEDVDVSLSSGVPFHQPVPDQQTFQTSQDAGDELLLNVDSKTSTDSSQFLSDSCDPPTFRCKGQPQSSETSLNPPALNKDRLNSSLLSKPENLVPPVSESSSQLQCFSELFVQEILNEDTLREMSCTSLLVHSDLENSSSSVGRLSTASTTSSASNSSSCCKMYNPHDIPPSIKAQSVKDNEQASEHHHHHHHQKQGLENNLRRQRAHERITLDDEVDDDRNDPLDESLEHINASDGERPSDDVSNYNPSDSDADSDGPVSEDICNGYEDKWKRLRFQELGSETSGKIITSKGSTNIASGATVPKSGNATNVSGSRSVVGILTRKPSPLKDLAIGRKSSNSVPAPNSSGSDQIPSESRSQLRRRRRISGTPTESAECSRTRNVPTTLGLRPSEATETHISSSDNETGGARTPEGSNKATLSSEEWEDRMQSDETTSSAYSSNSEVDSDERAGEEEKTEYTTSTLHVINLLQPQSGSPSSSGNITQPDRVSCVIWEGNECKKVDLTALDIGWAIIDKVDSLPESSDYFLIGLSFSFVICLVPLVFRAYVSRDSASLEDFLSWSYLMSKLVELPVLIRNSYSWRQYLLMINGILQRFFLSLIFFFLLAVADRTFKQRLLYAKHFSYLTSSRRARKFTMPHFRLNKVRNIKIWLSLRSYLKRRGPQRSVDVIVSACFLCSVCTVCLISLQMLKDTDSYLDYLCNWELLVWCTALGVFLMRFMTVGLKINKKYRNLSVLITEQINLYLQMEQKPHKKEELILANNVLRLAEDLLKELESPFKISGFSANPLIYNIMRVVVLSAFSAVLTEVLGFKLKLHKIKLKA